MTQLVKRLKDMSLGARVERLVERQAKTYVRTWCRRPWLCTGGVGKVGFLFDEASGFEPPAIPFAKIFSPITDDPNESAEHLIAWAYYLERFARRLRRTAEVRRKFKTDRPQ